ncbi:oligosaccharide flippase family protein [Microcoleus sp. FACHB-1515]|uniref:oligosaccharide flippase family protein n=1 Tax=Cyanophyceae TaxID=3028117 RepID=UPI0016871E5D|nr:oligosaccharide flippase family protein [Microcoleus sp. FACHB-1515]MBD2090414.1 oligosaccharide flippase family protein [Microcoleus sp. FACHB-1515]
MTSTSLKKQAIRGTIWTIGGYGAAQILRFSSNLVLTRLLAPELFGLMALVNIFIVGLHLFSDIGVNFNVVQNKRGDEPEYLNTAWTIQVIRGVILWVVCLLITWPLALLYEEPIMLWVIPILGTLSTLVEAFKSPTVLLLQRHMKVSLQIKMELVIQVVGIVSMIAFAWIRPSIWALVFGNAMTTLVGILWSYLLPGDRPKFAWNKEAVREIFSMGRWIFLSTALTFVAEQSDRLILGKLFPLELLGVYGLALMLSDVPRAVTMTLSSKIIFPAISKFSDLPRSELRSKILHNRKPLLLALTVGMALLIGFGDQVIRLLYDSRYQDAAWMLPILAIGIWPRLICVTIEPVLFSIGTVQYTTFGNFCRFAFTVAAIFLGFSWLGTVGAVIGVALNDLIYYLAVCYGLKREGFGCISQDLKATALLLGLVALFVAVRSLLGLGLPIDGWPLALP